MPRRKGVMNGFVSGACLAFLAILVGTTIDVAAASDGPSYARNWAEAAARHAQVAQQRQLEARWHWEYERRRSAAHARMPNTLYASTPSSQPHADLSCPVLADKDNREIFRRIVAQHGGGSKVPGAAGMDTRASARNAGLNVFSAGGRNTGEAFRLSTSATKNDSLGQGVQASAWSSTPYQSKATQESGHSVYLFPSASEPLREGFVRVINHSAEAGEVRIDPVDDGGRSFHRITLSIDANETVHFNSKDLETGNEGKGLSGSTGSGQGEWRLAFSSDLDIEVLSYIRTTDGFLTAMHDVAPEAEDGVRRIAIFNPGSNRNQISILRLINPGEEPAGITIRGTDDQGNASGEITLSLDTGMAREVSAEQLEMGTSDLDGMLGDGSGKWRLAIESDQPIVALSLLESPTDHLTNLSTVPEDPEDGGHSVPLFPAAGDASGRQGFVRVINGSAISGEVTIRAYDASERDYEPITLTIGANEVVHFNSDDLEQGNTGKGLSGGTGAGEGDWRLQLVSDLDLEVLSYIRTEDGFLTAMHDVVPSAGTQHRVAVFNPGSNRNQESLLRLINTGDRGAEVTIRGIDDKGMSGEDEVSLTLTAGESRAVEAWELESGAESLTGRLGDGSGKWQLMVEADQPVVAMSLLRSPTGHMTNLSTAPVRGARGGATQEPQTAEAVFRQLISGPIVQSKCITCHVEGGASGNTRLVFVPETDPDHEATNLQVFKDFLDEEEAGASYILNKIQGALGHGGGIQVAAGTGDYVNMERFLSLLGEDVGPLAITPETLFDGVTMESARSTLRRAAIVFAGRIPTDAEYDSIRTGGMMSLRAAIRGLMKGPEFHEFLIRASNDRLFTDREKSVISEFDRFVDYTNTTYDLAEAANASGDDTDLRNWNKAVQYGAMRAPLELIARVVEKDLPYTEILTADYIMANPQVAQAYGASTAFDEPDNVHEYQPSDVLSYYREGADYRDQTTPGIGVRVVNPGPLSTTFAHAGILSTKVFLQRYPTTPTNRNRARSRWTYYHFLGLDIEKSASRTTDPVALADTNNPTMQNPACAVCHTVLDPIAGAFQNYGDAGLYRDQWGGHDSLDPFYKEPATQVFSIPADSPADRQTVSVSTGWLRREFAGMFIGNPGNGWWDEDRQEGGTHGRDVWISELEVRDLDGNLVQSIELAALHEHCEHDGEYHSDGDDGDRYRFWGSECEYPLDVPADGSYVFEAAVWADQAGDEVASLHFGPSALFQRGDTWYRDMRDPGFDQELVPDAEYSLQWLSEKIVADERFSEATVKFWWPAIMGSEIAEPPEDVSNTDFAADLLTSNAQAAELKRLAGGFRRGFSGGAAYNLKDLLVQMVTSKWFRANLAPELDSVRAVALRGAGAKRLLSPEELARKTLALAGFQWGGDRRQVWRSVHDERRSSLTDNENGYGLLYGGIDSGGVKERAQDFTSVMAGVAQRHALESSCPIVLRERYLLPDAETKLFAGFDVSMAPTFEFGEIYTVEAEDRDDKAVLALRGRIAAGDKTVSISFLNDFHDQESDKGRHVRLDRLEVHNSAGQVLEIHELEFQDAVGDCNYPVGDHLALHCTGTVYVPISFRTDDDYVIEVHAWADQWGDALPMVRMELHSDTEESAGAHAVRDKIAELYGMMLGVQVTHDSQELANAYGLFVDVWERRRRSPQSGDFYAWHEGIDCEWSTDHRYLDGIVDDAFVWRDDWDWGEGYGWDFDRVRAHFDEIEFSDRHGAAETWSVILAYLMMDYRYLFL